MAQIVTTGQITIYDVNDSIFTGPTPPLNPIANVTLWCDTSVTPHQLKKWNGTAWINVGLGKDDYDDLQNQIEDLDLFISNTKLDLQNQIDGNITSWFYEHIPSLANLPASAWNTTTLQNNHLGDLFYNTLTGKAYRFQLVGGVYSWAVITDNDIAAALATANAAKDTADGKRRVFTAMPTNPQPYDVGDLWVNATISQYSDELLRCVTAKAAGTAFNLNHWAKASKYTDDAVAEEALNMAYDAQTAADNAYMEATRTIGGANKILEPTFTLAAGSNNYAYKVLVGSESATAVTPSPYLENGKSYVFSVEKIVRTTGSSTVYAIVLFDFTTGTSGYAKTTGISTSKQSATFTVPATGNWSLLLYAGAVGYTYGNTYNITKAMCQAGQKATEFTPAIEYLTTAMSGSTQIKGGLVLSNMMAVRNGSNTVVGGINGGETGGNDVRLWFGTSFDKMTDAPFKIMEDGTIDINNSNGGNTVKINTETLPALSTVISAPAFNAAESPVSYGSNNGDLDMYANPMPAADFLRQYITGFTVPADTINNVTSRKVFLRLFGIGEVNVPASYIATYGFPFIAEQSYCSATVNINGVPVLSRKVFFAPPLTRSIDQELEVNEIFNVNTGDVVQVALTLFLAHVPGHTQPISAQSPGEGYYAWDLYIDQESFVFTDDILALNRRTRVSPYGLSSILNNLNFFHLVQEGAAMKLGYRGQMDIPAGFGGGKSLTNNTITNRWGNVLDTSTRSNNSTTIRHTIGDIKYTVLCTPYSGVVCSIQSIMENYTQVYCAGNFDFILVRTPY